MSMQILEALDGLNQEEIYKKIIELGKQLPAFNQAWKVEENEVKGCQSLMYLHVEEHQEKLFFYAHSEALISAGLAYLLITFYNGNSAEWVLKNRPHFLQDLKITENLSPSRANGLASLYHQMKKLALKSLVSSTVKTNKA